MPVKNGPNSAKEIRAIAGNSFIVGVTGNLLQEDIDHFKSCGAHAVLSKPLNLAYLEETRVKNGVGGTGVSGTCGGI
jgi:hypothetical protein